MIFSQQDSSIFKGFRVLIEHGSVGDNPWLPRQLTQDRQLPCLYPSPGLPEENKRLDSGDLSPSHVSRKLRKLLKNPSEKVTEIGTHKEEESDDLETVRIVAVVDRVIRTPRHTTFSSKNER